MRPEFREKNLKDWDELLHVLFGGSIPDESIWKDKTDIIRILNLIGKKPNINHIFFPSGGGLDLVGARDSVEEDCIEIYFHEKTADIVRPKELIFQSFGNPYEWAYFRLETNKLEPSGVYENLKGQREELTEITPGDYMDRSYWDEGFTGYDESGRKLLLPESARVITRLFSGAFVIFAKGSLYNAINATYDGRHSKMTGEEFKQYIGKTVSGLKEHGGI
jgi:hypothetical protein